MKRMNNFERATIEYIYEILPKTDCTAAEFKKLMKLINKTTKELAECEHPWASILGDGETQPTKCLKCGKIL